MKQMMHGFGLKMMRAEFSSPIPSVKHSVGSKSKTLRPPLIYTQMIAGSDN